VLKEFKIPKIDKTAKLMDKTGQTKRNKNFTSTKKYYCVHVISLFSESLKVHNTEFERVSSSFESVYKKKLCLLLSQ
jgi:hypothetical protein